MVTGHPRLLQNPLSLDGPAMMEKVPPVLMFDMFDPYKISGVSGNISKSHV